MLYKVFLVEDEIVTREGIRDSVNWQASGFTFCGEAPDGELALPQINALRPDLLITDIKMPFMDGLELARLVREQLPSVRIVVLSGHDEFEYARAAISLGVTDYLLKPLGVRELESLLQRVAAQLDLEQSQLEERRRLHQQVESDQALRRDHLLLRLLTVGAPPTAAIEQSRSLGIDLSAATYQVLLVRSERSDHPGISTPVFFGELEALHDAIAALPLESSDLEQCVGWLALRKDIDETVLVAMGSTPEAVDRRVGALVAALEELPMPDDRTRLHIGIGTHQPRLQNLNLSFSAALFDLHSRLQNQRGAELTATLDPRISSLDKPPKPTVPGDSGAPSASPLGRELINLNRAALSEFLRSGLDADFDRMFSSYIGAPGASALSNPLVLSYIRTDITLTVAKFVNGMGGSVDYLFADLDMALHQPTTSVDMAALRSQMRDHCLSAIDTRDHRSLNRNAALIQRAQRMIDEAIADSNLGLGQVAHAVGLSPNHFSAIFSSATGETFRDYLTRQRMTRAKELLRSTSMSNSEVAEMTGYSDPHYFGAVFKRVMGVAPQQFRAEAASTNMAAHPAN